MRRRFDDSRVMMVTDRIVNEWARSTCLIPMKTTEFPLMKVTRLND